MSKSDHAKDSSDEDVGTFLGYQDAGVQDPEGSDGTAARVQKPDGVRCVVDAVLAAAMSDDTQRCLAVGEALAVVIRVPTGAWVAPVEAAIERINPQANVFARDGSNRSGHKADVGNGDVAKHLAKGRTVVGIAPSPATLPRALVAAADLTLELKIDDRILARAVARFVGATDESQETIDGLATLDLHDISAAFRAGSNAREIVERIRRAARRLSSPRVDRLPRLVDAVEYGRARDWGLALGCDFSEYNLGLLKWNDLGPNALFAGAPGLGKTFFARVLCAHLGIPLIPTSLSDIFATSAGYLDSVIKGIREVFARAEAAAPAAILWDELDSLPMRAELDDGRSSSWWTPVVTEYLTLLDSAAGGARPGVFVWAATNYPERIDPALIRPGRLDRIIEFTEPGPDGIVSIARHHLAGDLAGIDLTAIGPLGLGRSPAEIAAAVKAARGVARAEKRALVYDDMVEALAPRVDLDAATLRRIAEHEAGHVVTALAAGPDEVIAVDVVGNEGAFGRTIFRRRQGITTRSTVENRAIVHLGGRAAEAVVYDGDCAANAGGGETSDLALATEEVASLRLSMGLGDGLAYLAEPGAAKGLLRLDARLRAAVDADLARLHEIAVGIVRRHRASLDAIAAALVARRHLSGDEVRAIFASHPPSPA